MSDAAKTRDDFAYGNLPFVSVELEPSAWAKLSAIEQRLGMKRVKIISRMVDWVNAQSPAVQEMILRPPLRPQGVNTPDDYMRIAEQILRNIETPGSGR